MLTTNIIDPTQLASILADLPVQADWIGIRLVQETATTRSVRDGQPQHNHSQINWGAMVEVLINGQMGYGATNLLTPAGLQIAATAAVQQALATCADRLHNWSIAQRPRTVGEYISPIAQPLDKLSVGEINDLLIKICQTLKTDDRIIQTRALVTTKDIKTWYVSSNGSDIHQQMRLIVSDHGVTAQDNGVIQTRSDGGWGSHCHQGGWEYFQTPDLWDRVRRTGEQAVELLTASECPNMQTTLVLNPDQMLLQIHESIGHPLEIDRILGDERNYAGGSFVKPTDFGRLQYGSPLMNVTFDPTVSDEFASYGFDDSGTPASKEYLIKDGQLLRGLGSVDSQARSHLPGVACSRASDWNRPPIDRMANINLEPGNSSFSDIISGIESGVYMESNRSWSIDDQRHKFQFGCEYAKLIKDGQLTTTLRNPNYRDITPNFWGNLVAVGDASTWQTYGSPFCGKGEPNQMIWVGHGSPVAAFANVEVFGGG